MEANEKLFDKERVNKINEFVEGKSNILNEIKDFKEKEKILSLCMESLEKELSKEHKENFEKVIKLMYQVEEYYITLAYSLGTNFTGKI